jgi:predicted ATPase
MRILSLNINGYKIFNPSPKITLGKDIQLLIGVNGSGKSTVLEAIAIIFSQVKEYCENPKTRERKFNFSIEYSFNLSEIEEETTTTQKTKLSINHIFLSSSKETGLDFSMFVDKKEVTTPQEMYKYLPDNLIFCYSGTCETLENIIKASEIKQAEDLFNKRSKESVSKVINSLIKNIIYLKKEYYPLLFALNYIDREQKLPLSNKAFSIKNISFEIKQPDFSSNKDPKKLYNLSGFLRPYLDNLLKHSFGIQEDIDTKEPYFNVDYHRGIIEAVEDLDGLTEDQKYNQTRFIAFHLISLLFRIGLIKKISISITDDKDASYSIDDFSEGEQQLIVLDTIKKVLCTHNSVLFLDEPDAYLHPQRQREIIPYIKDIFTESYTQIIATTHSPFVAQSIPIEDILLFNNDNTIEDNLTKVLDYKIIADELFGIDKRFNREIEGSLDKFRMFRDKIMKDEKINVASFKKLITSIDNFGEETSIIINRELAQLKALKNFSV